MQPFYAANFAKITTTFLNRTTVVQTRNDVTCHLVTSTYYLIRLKLCRNMSLKYFFFAKADNQPVSLDLFNDECSHEI